MILVLFLAAIENLGVLTEKIVNLFYFYRFGKSLNADRFYFLEYIHIKRYFSPHSTEIIVQIVAFSFNNNLNERNLLTFIKPSMIFEVVTDHEDLKEIIHMYKSSWVLSQQFSELF